jgi:membrane-associated protein
VTPILPGDSLLFVAGALAAVGNLEIHVLVASLVLAAFLGNMANYAIGRWLGKKFFVDRKSKLLNPEHLEKAHAFYEHHGGKAVVISRFLPIIRTYIPFVAGLGAMPTLRFTLFNIGGAVAWVASLCYAGFYFGNIPWIRNNLTAIIVGIIAVSLVPVAIAWFRGRK